MSIRDRKPDLRPDSPGMDNFVTFAPLVVGLIALPLGLSTGDPAFAVILGVGGIGLFLYFFLTGPIFADWKKAWRRRRAMKDPAYRARAEKIAKAREDVTSGNPAKRAAAQKVLDELERQQAAERAAREHDSGVEAKDR
jgi:hypothetical protein